MIARSAAGVANAAGAQSAGANAVVSMAMPASRAKAEPMRRRLMHAAKVARNLAGMEGVKVEARVEAKAALRVGTSAGQTATRVSMTQCKRVLPPTPRTALPTTQRHSVIRGSRLRDSMKATARRNQASMPMAVRGAKNVRVTAMAVTVARVATEVIVASARTRRHWTTSSRWKALPLIPEDHVRYQPRSTVNHAPAILQFLRPHRLHLHQQRQVPTSPPAQKPQQKTRRRHCRWLHQHQHQHQQKRKRWHRRQRQGRPHPCHPQLCRACPRCKPLTCR